MRKYILLLIALVSFTVNAAELSYEEAFDSIKAIPNMKGVEGTMISGHNDFKSLGITDGQLIVWDNESGNYNETAVYGNTLYRIMGALPAADLIQGSMSDQTIFVIFARKVANGSNRILILSDSAHDGFTGALIGYIDDQHLSVLRNAILMKNCDGGTSIYLRAMQF